MIERKFLMKQVGFAVRLLAASAVLVFAALAVAGCGDNNTATTDSNGDKQYAADQPLGDSKKVAVDSEKKFDAEQQAVVDKIVAFGDATASQDYKTLCNKLLSKDAAKIGGDCVSTFEKTGQAIKDFKLTIKSVNVNEDGKTAKAQISVTSTQQPKAQLQDLSLAKESGDWRIQILGQ
jgi:ABC-type proline/glycine betaine transport system substrate-binding protein